MTVYYSSVTLLGIYIYFFLVVSGLAHAGAFTESWGPGLPWTAGMAGPLFPQGLCSSKRLNYVSSAGRGGVPRGQAPVWNVCQISACATFADVPLTKRSHLTMSSQCGKDDTGYR